MDYVVVEHGTMPHDDLYFDLVADSSNLGEVDHEALIKVQPQAWSPTRMAGTSCSVSAMP